MPHAYPAAGALRRAFITARRPAVFRGHDPWQAHGIALDDEPDETLHPVRTGTIFLTGSECPWRCAMCDLWRYTTVSPTPPGAIAAQVRAAMHEFDARGGIDHVKLYNAGSFFDRHAVPEGDLVDVAHATRSCARVVVESHPALIGAATSRLLDHLHAARSTAARQPILEVAMGLETVHPVALDSIDKGVTVQSFRFASRQLRAMGAGLRVFLLINPPFVPAGEQDLWLGRSIDEAVAADADVISLIPTRPGNGTMEALSARGQFTPPTIATVERALELALARRRPPHVRIVVDLWDIDGLTVCPDCASPRQERLRRANLDQHLSPAIACPRCDNVGTASPQSLP